MAAVSVLHRVAKAGLLAAILAGLTACGGGDQVYPVTTPDQARAALEGTEIPEALIGGGAHATPARIVGNDVLWYAETNGGVRVLQLWARLEPTGEGTRATIEVQPGSAAIGANLAAHPDVGEMFASLAREQVDSVLTGREFAAANVSGEIAAALAPAQPVVEAGFRQAEAMQARERAAAIDRAYNDAARSREDLSEFYNGDDDKADPAADEE